MRTYVGELEEDHRRFMCGGETCRRPTDMKIGGKRESGGGGVSTIGWHTPYNPGGGGWGGEEGGTQGFV